MTRRRRPFFAPVWLSLLAFLALVVLTWSFWHDGRTTLVLVVYPGKAPLATIADPPITPEGEARAQRLVRLLEGSTVDAAYVSDDRLAQQTAGPLLEALHRAPVRFSVEQAGQLAARLLKEHAGSTVIVMAGGEAAGQVLSGLSGSTVVTPDQAQLYVVSVPRFGQARLLRLHL